MVPVIETKRLLLRGHSKDDFTLSAQMWKDPEVTRFIGGRPFTEEESWARFLRYAGLWYFLGFGYWAIEEKATGAFVGEVGCADFRRDIEPSIAGIPEFGWVLIPRAHGRGLATEAVQAALNWCDSALAAPRTVCLISPENVASIRVAEKCGFREHCRTVYKDQIVLLCDRNPIQQLL
jgi:RimJ/RimL family protein N-acetyltransferase